MLTPGEKSRRYELLRGLMRSAGADALVVISRAIIGDMGAIRYVCDHRLPNRQAYAVFVGDADPIVVMQTPSHRVRAQINSGLSDVRDRPRQVEEVGDILAGLPSAVRLVLIAGMNSSMPVDDYLYLRERFPNAELRDATLEMNHLKSIKSPEEIEYMRESMRIADLGFRRFLEVVGVGRSEREVVADVDQTLRHAGAEETMVLIATSPRAPYIAPPTDHVLKSGDVVNFGVECGGPRGYWAQRGGVASLGEPSPQMSQLHDDSLRIIAQATQMFRPGIIVGEAAGRVKGLIEGCGHRMVAWTGHAIGLDIQDGPVLLKAERRLFEENLTLAFHPQIADQHGNGAYIADTYVVTPNGAVGFSSVPFELHIR
ncbi:MAG: M24 family metallopeptidase [Chloroflexi bacterium]|nr:M24 family metallopeptidase [Chloroflexota bacterium]